MENLPVFEETATRFRVTLSTERVGGPTLDATDQGILDVLAVGGGLPTSEIAKSIDLTSREHTNDQDIGTPFRTTREPRLFPR